MMKSYTPRKLECQNCGNTFTGVEDQECHICGGQAKEIEKTVLMFSGGKDSTYLIKYCLENNIEIDEYLFCDTTLQLPIVYEWINHIEWYFDIDIRRKKPSVDFEEKFYQIHKNGNDEGEIWGYPYVTTPCWIRRDLKLKGMYERENVTYVIGYTSDEYDRDVKSVDYIAPLRENGISSSQVIKRLKSADLYPPLYKLLEKYDVKKPRSGCYFCPKANFDWFRMLYWEFPKYWEKTKKYAKDDPKSFKPDMTIEELEKEIEYKGELFNINSKMEAFC